MCSSSFSAFSCLFSHSGKHLQNSAPVSPASISVKLKFGHLCLRDISLFVLSAASVNMSSISLEHCNASL